MTGITSYGAYIPQYRINRKVIQSAIGFLGAGALPGEKAAVNYDEDSITMAVAAGVNCLNGTDRSKIDGLYFATVSQPYTVRQNAGIIASVLDLQPNIRSADFTTATKSGTSALLAALDAAKGEAKGNILVCAADCRLSKPGGALEHMYGDGAAAVMVGNDNVIATLEGHYSVSYDIPDKWKADREKYEHVWEDRFVRDIGYIRIIPEVIAGLMKKYNLTTKDFTKIIYPCPYAREHGAIAKQLGAEANQIQDTMMATVGDTGSAHPLMMLVAALEEAKPGDKILVAGYGNGGDALFFKVTENISKIKNKRGIAGNLAAKRELSSYEKYITFRNIIPIELGIRGEQMAFTQMSTLYRERKVVMALVGSKCKRCGTPQYPYQRVCVKPDCGAIDEMEEYLFSDKKASLFSYTADNLAASIDPPEIYGLVDFEGGGRYWFDITDCDIESIKVGLPLEMTFRRKYVDEARGVHGYFWKAIPIRS